MSLLLDSSVQRNRHLDGDYVYHPLQEMNEELLATEKEQPPGTPATPSRTDIPKQLGRPIVEVRVHTLISLCQEALQPLTAIAWEASAPAASSPHLAYNPTCPFAKEHATPAIRGSWRHRACFLPAWVCYLESVHQEGL